MRYAERIVLYSSGTPNSQRLEELVEEFIRSGVKFVGCVGTDCDRLEDLIDEIVVGDGTDEIRCVLTSSHKEMTLGDAVEFANTLTGYEGEVQVVEL